MPDPQQTQSFEDEILGLAGTPRQKPSQGQGAAAAPAKSGGGGSFADEIAGLAGGTGATGGGTASTYGTVQGTGRPGQRPDQPAPAPRPKPASVESFVRPEDANVPMGVKDLVTGASGYPSTGGMLKNFLKDAYAYGKGLVAPPTETLPTRDEFLAQMKQEQSGKPPAPAPVAPAPDEGGLLGSIYLHPGEAAGNVAQGAMMLEGVRSMAAGSMPLSRQPSPFPKATPAPPRGSAAALTSNLALPAPPKESGLEGATQFRRGLSSAAGSARQAASGQYETALRGPLGDVQVPTGEQIEPPPGSKTIYGPKGEVLSAPKPTPETIPLREAHEAKTMRTPRETTKPTPQSRMAARDVESIEDAMRDSAAKQGVDFSPYDRAKASWSEYKQTYGRGMAKKMLEDVTPGDTLEFLKNPQQWVTGQGKSMEYVAGKAPIRETPGDVVDTLREAHPAGFKRLQQHVQASVINDAVTPRGRLDPAVLEKQLAQYDKHGVTNKILPDAAKLRQLVQDAKGAQASLEKQQALRAKVNNMVVKGLKLSGAGALTMYGYEKVKDLLSP